MKYYVIAGHVLVSGPHASFNKADDDMNKRKSDPLFQLMLVIPAKNVADAHVKAQATYAQMQRDADNGLF